jgi:hypothetical protein
MKVLIAISTSVLAFLGVSTYASGSEKCFDNSLVTGYYGVQLEDYDLKKTTTIKIDGVDHTYNASFIEFTKAKSAGISEQGENLVYHSDTDQWTLQLEPFTAQQLTWFPFEADYTHERTIRAVENGKKYTFVKAFVDEAGLEGSGRIKKGKVLGTPGECIPSLEYADPPRRWLDPSCDNQWHFRGEAKTRSGNLADIGDAAVDQKFLGSTVLITPTPKGMENVEIKGTDTGEQIHDGHVDLFTGWGPEALKRTFLVTGDRYHICFRK